MTSGEPPPRTAISMSGDSFAMHAIAKDPFNSFTEREIASTRSPPAAVKWDSMRWAMTSVSVCDRN